jgi:perosamine synthetase
MANGMRIPLARPDVREDDVQRVAEVLRGNRLARGPWTERFEQQLAGYVGVRHAVAVSSGTSALHLIVRALGIGPGDDVITTPFSFVASTNAILFEGATPVFADIDPQTLCIDPEAVERAVTPQTKAILAVDVFGRPADWIALEAVADRHGLELIEDSAEALGSNLDGRRCGSFGRVGVFGFYPNKQITTGEGGMIVTDDEDLAGLCRSMANQGRSADDRWLQHVRLGYNYRMDEMSAALGCSQLERIDEIVAARAQVASWYAEALEEIEGLVLLSPSFTGQMSWFVYVVRLSEAHSKADRDGILQGLSARGIGCGDYFQPIHLQPFLRDSLGTRFGQLPVTEFVSERTIALPFYVGLTRAEVDFVAAALAELLEIIDRQGRGG